MVLSYTTTLLCDMNSFVMANKLKYVYSPLSFWIDNALILIHARNIHTTPPYAHSIEMEDELMMYFPLEDRRSPLLYDTITVKQGVNMFGLTDKQYTMIL